MKEIVNRIIAEVLKVIAARHEQTRMGIVDGFDPTTHTVRVRIQPENVLTGWLPIHVNQVGNGWGIYSPPSIGDQVHVSHLEGDRNSGQVTGAVNDDTNKPPAVPSGEFWLVHKSGSFIKLTNDGKISLNSTAEIDAGNLAQGLHALVTDAMVAFFNTHTHNGGHVPDQVMGSAELTTILRGN